MLFSERYGYKKVKMLKKDEMPDSLRTRIWNVFYKYIFSKIGDPEVQFISNRFDAEPYRFLDKLWDDFFKKDLQVFGHITHIERVLKIRDLYNKLQWFEIYDLIEFFLSNIESRGTKNLIWGGIASVLELENTSYRIIEGLVVPLTSEEEIKEIKKVYDIPSKYDTVKEHYEKALKFFSMRPDPDYANSIKEAISAVESLVMVRAGEKKELSKLIDKLDIHPQLKQGFKNLYNWTSDDSGIRHGEFGASFPCDEPEARYMLITCAAFINYLISKHSAQDH
jgi:hypothetical protein